MISFDIGGVENSAQALPVSFGNYTLFPYCPSRASSFLLLNVVPGLDLVFDFDNDDSITYQVFGTTAVSVRVPARSLQLHSR